MKHKFVNYSIALLITLSLLFGLGMQASLAAEEGLPAQAGPAQAAPAAGEELTLVINNKSGANVWLTLEGEQNYYFSLGGGKTRVEVSAGKYKYSYWACDAWQAGTLEVKKNNQKFVIESCAALSKGNASDTPAKGAELTLNNKTGANVYLTLTGPQTYYYSLGDSKLKVDVLKGDYEYSYFACGKYNTGTLKVKNKQTFTLPGCSAGGAVAGTRKMVILNNTGGWLYLSLRLRNASTSYQLRLPSGKSTVYIVPGDYDYTVSGVCGTMTGRRRLGSGMRWQFWCQ